MCYNIKSVFKIYNELIFKTYIDSVLKFKKLRSKALAQQAVLPSNSGIRVLNTLCLIDTTLFINIYLVIKSNLILQASKLCYLAYNLLKFFMIYITRCPPILPNPVWPNPIYLLDVYVMVLA
jgi:hypothetical protein